MVKSDRRVVAAGLIQVVAFCALSGCTTTHTQGNARSRIVGTWQLESRTVRKANGEVLLDPVLGKEPIGRLFYAASGHMALQMMRQDRVQPISVPSNPEDAKNPRVVLGYDAYFGTFDVNEAEGTVTHHVEGSLFPEDLRKDFKRFFKIEGDTFTLSFTSAAPQGLKVTRTLVFRRSK
jgi:hypothetical protein